MFRRQGGHLEVMKLNKLTIADAFYMVVYRSQIAL